MAALGVTVCSYCERNGLTARGSDFARNNSDICASCGTNMAKEAAKRAARAAAMASRDNPWGASLPENFATAGMGSHGGRGFVRPISHAPSVAASWLPTWLVAEARRRGFAFDDPSKRTSSVGVGGGDATASSGARSRQGEVSTLVGAMWRRAMPQSNCWHIHAQCRIVAFDISSSSSSSSSSSPSSLGSPAGACYFDTNNKYIPCVCVDDAYRRRGLGSLLVVAAVAICESIDGGAGVYGVSSGGGEGGGLAPVSSVRGARPNLTVSPKDIERQPHLHGFYEGLGFFGGRAGRGGNYTLQVDAAAGMLRKYSGKNVAAGGAGRVAAAT